MDGNGRGFYAWSRKGNAISYKPLLDFKLKDEKGVIKAEDRCSGVLLLSDEIKIEEIKDVKEKIPYIFRVSSRGHYSWRVRCRKQIKKKKVGFSKHFPDLKFGGEKEALVAAIKFRDEHIEGFSSLIKKEQEPLQLLSGEEWMQIEEFGGRFKVSSYGRIMSVYELESKIIGSKISENGIRIPLKQTIRIDKIKEMKPRACYVDGKVHEYRIQFQDPTDKQKKAIRAAQCVAKAFLPNPLNRKKVRHKDGNSLNCRVENLEWMGDDGKYSNKEEYIEHLKSADVGERKSEDITNAIIEYLEGNTSKMEEILGNNRRVIFRKIYWMVIDLPKAGNTADVAEDLTQETLIRIYKKINELVFRYPKNPVGWFIRIAQNVTRNYIVKMSKERLVAYKPGWGKHENLSEGYEVEEKEDIYDGDIDGEDALLELAVY